MLCCVSRKSSGRSKNKKKDNHDNDKTSILYPEVSSSSGISSSSFDSSDNFDSSGTSGLTSTLSSSSDTSGFLSSPKIRAFENSSTDSFSIPSAFACNLSDEDSKFLVDNSNSIRTVGQNSSDIDLSGAPKQLLTFSSPSKRDNIPETSINLDSKVEQQSSIEDEPTELLPCAICARTFKPQSLEKHTKICELAAIKKRKPFDSAKQRIQGTELAEFLPKETTKRKVYQPEERISSNKGSWKETHDEFLRAIRAARGEPIETNSQRQLVPTNNVTVGVPTRPNEKGMCPTCNRQFSIKSYERHVAWCKERATRVPLSAATNIAKERLEARMRYRAPALKNRRQTNREKYSPSSALNLTSLTNKSNNANSSNQRAKEIASMPNCNEKSGNENTMGNIHNQKSTINTRRSGQSREGISSGPMKSRLSDRSNRPLGENDPGTSNCPSPGQNSSRISKNSCHRNTRVSPTRMNFSKISNSTMRTHRKIDNAGNAFDEIDETDETLDEVNRRGKGNNEGAMKNRRHRQNIVQSRSHGNPRVNDITINNDVIGMTVLPCARNKNPTSNEEFVTWKKIGEKTSMNNDYLKFHSIEAPKFIPTMAGEINSTGVIGDESNFVDEKIVEMENISWASGIEKLDRTYLIRESLDGEMDLTDFFPKRKRKPVIDSPRVEFYYDKKTMEKIFYPNFDDNENSSRSNFGKKVASEKQAHRILNQSRSPLSSRCLELRPLNLNDVENENSSEKSGTRGSVKSTISSKKTDRSKSKRNTPKSQRISSSQSSDLESLNFDDFETKNNEDINSFNSKKHINEIDAISTPSSVPKNVRSSINDSKILSEPENHSAIPKISIQESTILRTSDEKKLKNRGHDDIDSKNNSRQDSESLKTSRSLKSTEFKNDNCEKPTWKNTIKLNNVIIENKLIPHEQLNFSNNEENLDLFNDMCVKISENENLPILDSSRSFTGKKSSDIDCEKIEMKIGETKPIIEIESFSNDSLNVGSCYIEKTDDLTIDKEETEANSESPRSEEKAVSSRSNCDDLLAKKMADMRLAVKNLDFESYDRNYNGKVGNNDSSCDVRSKIDSEANLNILSPNCSELLTKEEILSSIECQSNTNEQSKEYEERTIAQGSKVNDRGKRSRKSSMEKNDGKTEKLDGNENCSLKKGAKMNYRRCGTYVLDKKTEIHVDAKHHTPDELLDEKPLKKRRKTENIGTQKEFEKSTDRNDPMRKKSMLDDEEETNIKCVPEKIGTPECSKDFETAKERKIDINENDREPCEEYANRKNIYENDKILEENVPKYIERERSTNIEKNLSSECERSNCNCRGKKKSGFRGSRKSTFSEIQENSEYEDSPEMTRGLADKRSANIFRKIKDETESETSFQVDNESKENNLNERTFSIVDKSSKFDGKLSFLNNQEIPEGETCSKIRRESAEKEFIDTIEETPEAQSSPEMRQKSITVNCILPQLSEKPEVQNSMEIRRKLREKMKLLRGDTNNLITSIETFGEATANENSLSNVASLDVESIGEIEEETVREIDFCKIKNRLDNKADYCGFLPEIPINRIIAKNDNYRRENKNLPIDRASCCWQKAINNTNKRLINLDPPKFHRETKIPSKRLGNVGNLPPVVEFGKEKRRISDRDSRAVWSSYVRRRPDFNFVLTGRTGSCADYDPFLIAERQMNDLLSDTCSEKSITDTSTNRRRSSSPSLPNYPLSHSSAFIKYPDAIITKHKKVPEKRVSLIAPPTEFDDFSSDSTETNSISREIDNIRDSGSRSHDNCQVIDNRRKNSTRDHVLGRKIIIDKSKALGTKNDEANSSLRSIFDNPPNNGKIRKFNERTTPKVTRSNSVRKVSGPKANERKSNDSGTLSADKMNTVHNNKNNNYASLSGSTVSLSSIVSTDIDVNRSNSMFDEILSSCDDDTSGVYPSLRFLLKNDSLSVTSPVQSNRPRNGQISDEEFSSPDSYKRHHEHNKLSADSAYSSLNRKYSNHGRSTNDMAGRHDEDSPLHRRDVDNVSNIARSKMSKFCHECGSKFPATAKFCCECGIKRLAL